MNEREPRATGKGLTLEAIREVIERLDPQPREPVVGVIFVVPSWGTHALKVSQPVQEVAIRNLFGANGDDAWDACKRLRRHEFALILGARAWDEFRSTIVQPHPSATCLVRFDSLAAFHGVPVVELEARPEPLSLFP